MQRFDIDAGSVLVLRVRIAGGAWIQLRGAASGATTV